MSKQRKQHGDIFLHAAQLIVNRRTTSPAALGACEAISDAAIPDLTVTDGEWYRLSDDAQAEFTKLFKPRAREMHEFETGDAYWMSCYAGDWDQYDDQSRVIALLLMHAMENDDDVL